MTGHRCVIFLPQKKQIFSNIVIGADGVESRVGRWAGIRTNIKMKDMESALQYSVSNINLKNIMQIMNLF